MTIKVLTIDDDPAMTEMLTLLLQNNKYDVVSASNGEDGIALVKDAHPDIILLDIMMPGKDGWQVCEEIRSFSNTPIMVLSAIKKPAMIASTLDAGADDYLIKPVPGSILLAHIKSLTRRNQANHNMPTDTTSLQNAPAFA